MIRRALTLMCCGAGLAGAWPAAASADNGNLWLYGTAATGDTGQPVLGGTGPGIAGLTTGGYEATWQGPDGVLTTAGSNGSGRLGLAMAKASSPAITAGRSARSNAGRPSATTSALGLARSSSEVATCPFDPVTAIRISQTAPARP